MKRYLALLLALVMCFSLAACSNETGGGGGGGGSKTGTELASEQKYVTYISSEPMTLDLNRRSDTYSSTILTNILEGLTRLDENDAHDAYEYVPAGAKSWSSNEDDTVWTFELNENYWDDGQKVTADDYVYSVRRYVDPNTGSPLGYRLACLKNYEGVNSGELPVEELGIRAVDEDTLEITLEAPTPYFMDLTHGMLFRPQRQDIVEQHGDKYGAEADTVVSNGPFKITSWTHNSEITLVKNDKYWDADNVTLDEVTVKIIADANTSVNAFANGEMDYVSTTTVEWVERFNNTEGVVPVSYPSSTLTYSFFNTKDKIFSNANIRKAFITGIDRVEINDMCFGGARIPTYGWVVPTLYCGDINFREFAGDPVQEMIDELEAEGKTPKDLLLQGMQELGLGNDPSTLDVTFSFGSTNTLTRNIGEYLQQVFKTELGVEIETSFNEWGIFNSNVQSGDYQAGFMGWGAYYNDPYDTLSLLLTGSTAINTGWANEEYDSILNAATAEMDEETRMQEYIKAEQILINEECVVSPMATNQVQRFFQPYVKGYSDLGFTNTGSKYIYIEK